MILIRTRRMIVIRALLALVVGVGAAGLSAGCDNSLKSDGQIQASPEAGNAAQAATKNYGENMAKKYANQMKNRKN
jgi:hypothetical protein